LVLGFLDGKTKVPVDRSFPANPAALRDVRRFIRELAADVPFHNDVADDLVQAVSEAAANCVRHTDCREMQVSWRAVADGAEVLVRDRGVFRDKPHGTGADGFGLPLIEALVDEVAIHEGTTENPGTRVRLVKYKR
jgi:anti-sigma regulatory factor (Ser/Thr protein kinase)